MDIDSRMDLVKKGGVAEVITDKELKELFETKAHPRHYIGFEISGLVHIATGLLTTLKVKDFMRAGVKPTIFLADYHAWLNKKMGGDLDLIQKIAKGYFKQCFQSLGLEEGPVDFVMGSDLYAKIGLDYWSDVMRVTNNTTKERMLRCTTIMGRKEGDAALPTSVMMYPAMQVADIWALDVDIAHAGMDQRKVHVLAREMAEKMKKPKPIAVHGALLSGLQGGARMDPSAGDDAMIENKMSKSNPNSCIFIHDSADEILRKMKKAHCPAGIVEANPVIEMADMFVLRDRALRIERDSKFGGDVEYADIALLKKDFSDGKLHPVDLKNAVGRELVDMLEPARKYFAGKEELIEMVKKARE
ncbi:MAG: tyrosine--tRNA ligase [Candidatus Micrarchaeota archaeon]